MEHKFKKILSLLLRIGLSVALLGWLFSHIDFKSVWQAVRGADPAYMLLAMLVFLVTNALVFSRWYIFIKSLKIKAGRMLSLRWFLIGLFCNLFLPTSVGGDVIKALGLAKQTGQKPKVIASVVLDRLSGFAGIVLVASVAFFGGRAIVDDHSLLISIGLMALVSAILAAVLFSRRIFGFACRIFSFLPKLKQSLLNMHDDIVLMRGQYKQGLETIALSGLAQIILAVVFFLTALSMHQNISLLYFIIFSPLVCVATALPSIGGLGVREVGWVYLLSKVGVDHNVALGLSLTNFMFTILLGLVGGVLLLTGSTRTEVSALAKEADA